MRMLENFRSQFVIGRRRYKIKQSANISVRRPRSSNSDIDTLRKSPCHATAAVVITLTSVRKRTARCRKSG